MNLPLRIANYISRYAPSEKKLKEYISKKNPTFPTSEFLKENWYTEELMIDMWMRTFFSTGIGMRDIQSKLLKKWFPKSNIEKALSHNEADIKDWNKYSNIVEQKIANLQRRWKSLQSIQIILIWKYPYFRDEIRDLLRESSDTDNLEKEYEKYQKKYNIRHPLEKQKLILALQRRWYTYSDIKDVLSSEKI